MSLKDTFLKLGFVFSSLALAIIYFLYQRRGRTLMQLKLEAEKQLLAQELVAIKEQAQRSEQDYEEAMERYQRLKFRHADLLSKLGIGLATITERPGSRGNRRVN